MAAVSDRPGAGWIRYRQAGRTAAVWTAAAAVAAGVSGLGLSSAVTASAVGPSTVSAAGSGSAAGSYLVRAGSGQYAALTADLSARGMAVQRPLQIIDTAVVRLTSAQNAALATDPLVTSITPDGSVRLASNEYDPTADADSAYNAASLMGAHKAWAAGLTGAGIDVALVDSGVAPVAGLAAAGQVVYGPDLSFEAGHQSTRNLDTYGHGTALAGLIGAHDPDRVGGDNGTSYQGVAPGARIVSVKVADALGRSDVSQVIAGIDWVVQHAHDPGLNIRVLNLSFGTDTTQSYLLDPLAFAAEVAWRRGIVVVASSGNGGKNTMAMPAADPFVIAVGALDSHGTLAPGDDTVASFTSTGSASRHDDVLAPGDRLQSLRVPGSYLDTLVKSKGSIGINARFFRGSGTSQAAALTSGAVALLLQQRPELTPDQIKALLQGTGRGVRARTASLAPRSVNVAQAMVTPAPQARQLFQPATGRGSIAASRGSMKLTKDGAKITGEVDALGRPIDTASLAWQESGAGAWVGSSWNGASWASTAWAGASWASDNWQGVSWDGAGWAGAGWAGAGWAGASWAGASWAGAGWAGAGWAGEDFS